MKLPSLAKMPFDALIELRDEAEALIKKQAKGQRKLLERQLANVSRFFGGMMPGSGKKRGRPPGKHKLAGTKVAPKYRNPDDHSQTWAGRGMTPKWLAALMREGHPIEQFAIKGGAAANAKGPAKKAGRKPRADKGKARKPREAAQAAE